MAAAFERARHRFTVKALARGESQALVPGPGSEGSGIVYCGTDARGCSERPGERVLSRAVGGAAEYSANAWILSDPVNAARV